MSQSADQRIINLVLDETTVPRRSAEIEHDRAVAVYDLLEENVFSPVDNNTGPFHLRLCLEDNRLRFDVQDEFDGPLTSFHLPLQSFRSIIKDYSMICDSYYAAVKSASPTKIESIDMGRRGLHDEGGELLKTRLESYADVDFATARRLFTLLCVLHAR